VATGLLTDLHQQVTTPLPGEWRATVIQPAQSFSQYAQSSPVQPTPNRNTIYVQPIGTFSETQRRIVDLSSEFLGLYFSCPITVLPAVGDEDVPPEARRIHAGTKEEQYLAPWIHSTFLKSQLPENAVALIALTATDLWPGKNWNFVFGQASLADRVGVWSMARFGDPDLSDADYLECLRRTLKTATHETGHMFSMQHCVYFECNMAGSGSLVESDKKPLYLCPECLAKLHWSTHPDPATRLAALAEFCRDHGLHSEYVYYKQAQERLASRPVVAE
jgi:archaemetzincin